jgi:hypothetical protein
MTTPTLLALVLLATQAPAAPAPPAEAPATTEAEASPAPSFAEPAELDETVAPGKEAPVVVTPTAPPPAEEPKSAMPKKTAPRLLVMDLVDEGAGPEATAAIISAVASQAIQSHVGEVVTTAQLKVALDASSLQQMAGCMSESCMVDIAKTVEADRVLGGSVARAGDDYVITVLVVDPSTGARVDQRQRKVPSSQDMYFYAAKQLTSLVLTGRTVDPLVPVAISSSQPDAMIIVDGQSRGIAPATLQLDPGDHEIRVQKDGFVAWKSRVTIEEATPLSVRADLVATRFPLWPFAISTGVLATAAAGGAAYFELAALNAYDGTLGDPAQSYLHAVQPDTAFLAEKQAEVQQRAIAALVLWGTAATLGVTTVVLGGFELATMGGE